MKRIFFIACLVGLINPAFTQQPELPAPPNMVWLSGNLFIDRSEVANINWLEYQYYLKQDSSIKAYELSQPWVQFSFNEKITGFQYLTQPEYRYYPVVGITYEQAMAYCKWRTDAVNKILSVSPEKFIKVKQGQKVKVLFRLPTEDEWEFAFGLADSVASTLGRKSVKHNAKHCAQQNGPLHNMPLVIINNAPRTKRQVMKMKTLRDLMYLQGNVSEMITEKGIAKGGSYKDNCDVCLKENKQAYDKPAYWLGFRCVAEVFVENP